MNGINWLVLLALILCWNNVPMVYAAERPTEVINVERGRCGWQQGYLVTFETEEQVMVSLTSITKPFVGPLGSFWRAYLSLDWPFWHAAGFTQIRADNSHTGRIHFIEC